MKRFVIPALVAVLTLTQAASANFLGLGELAQSTVEAFFKIKGQQAIYQGDEIVKRFNDDLNRGLPYSYTISDRSGIEQFVLVRTAKQAKLGNADELFSFVATRSAGEVGEVDTLSINVSRYFPMKADEIGETMPMETAFANLPGRVSTALLNIQSTHRGYSREAMAALSRIMVRALDDAETSVRVIARPDADPLVHANVELRVPFDDLVPGDLSQLNDALSRVVGTSSDDLLRVISLE